MPNSIVEAVIWTSLLWLVVAGWILNEQGKDHERRIARYKQRLGQLDSEFLKYGETALDAAELGKFKKRLKKR